MRKQAKEFGTIIKTNVKITEYHLNQDIKWVKGKMAASLKPKR
jgi:hypothetical protein